MSVIVFTGAPGHGKTYELYTRLTKEAIANPRQRFVLVVPEQSSLQAQKELVLMNPNKGVFNIDVLTFGRMTYRIFDEQNYELPENIDDTGKNLIVRKILNETAPMLTVIKPNNNPGLVGDIKSIISELKQYGIKPDKLPEIQKLMPLRLSDKLNDIRIIYEAFEKYIEGRYTTATDRSEAMLGLLDNSHYFDDAVVAFDDFTGFTPVQYDIISKISGMAADMYFTATLPGEEPYNVIRGENDLFLMSKRMMQKIAEICDLNRVPFEVRKIQTDRDRFRFAKSKALEFLHNNIFSYNRAVYGERTDEVRLACMKDVTAELRYVSAEIMRLTRDYGMRYRDIAVVVGDMDIYRKEAERVFSESGIPAFVDSKRSIMFNPLVGYLKAVADIICNDFSYDGVFALLKNGLSSMERRDVDLFDNYVIAYGIRGRRRYENEFTAPYPKDDSKSGRINELRLMLLDILKPFERIFAAKTNTVREYVLSVYNFLEAENIYEKMLSLSAEYEFTERETEYRKTYGIVIALLEQIDALLGDEIMEPGEFFDILQAGFSEIKVGSLPPLSDSVTVGDIERTRLEHIKALFVVGVNEGMIPRFSSTGGILSDNDRRILADSKVELSPTPREKVFIQNYYLYLLMSKPSEILYLLCHRFDRDGTECRESRIFNMVRHMFPKTRCVMGDELDTLEQITTPKGSMHLVSDPKTDGELIMYYLNTDRYRAWLEKILDAVDKLYSEDTLAKETAQRLYSDMSAASISRVEAFAKCAFAHFASYGLELSERKVYELRGLDRGTILHSALFWIFSEIKKRDINANPISDEELDNLVRQSVDGAINEQGTSFFGDTKTNEYMRCRMYNIVARTTWALLKQLESGSFVPKFLEKTFNGVYDGVPIRGKVDRIDISEDDESVHVKIIDYKSSNETLTPDEIYAGISLQLMVYLKTVLMDEERNSPMKKVYAAGVFYNHIDDPVVAADDGKTDEENVLIKFKPTGFVGYESIDRLDSWDSGQSMVAPVGKSKDGQIKLGKGVYTDRQLRTMADYATNKVSQLTECILDGEIKAQPVENACEYCKYTGVCHIKKNGEPLYKKIEKISDTADMWLKFGYKEEN